MTRPSRKEMARDKLEHIRMKQRANTARYRKKKMAEEGDKGESLNSSRTSKRRRGVEPEENELPKRRRRRKNSTVPSTYVVLI